MKRKVSSIRKLEESIRDDFRKSCKKQEVEISDITISYPPKIEMGDFAIPVFSIAKENKREPDVLAKKISETLPENDYIQWARADRGFVNIKIKNGILFSVICNEVEKRGERFGWTEKSSGKNVMVEYLSPNTNKPLHLGHIRNGVLGMTTSRILEANGHKVIKANLINDRGIHICKSMLAYQKWGKGETPQSSGVKGDHFVGNMYVLFNQKVKENPSLEKEVREMLQRWEAGDPEIKTLWKTMNNWVYEGFKETYDTYQFLFDEYYYESETYEQGKNIVQKGVESGIFEKTSERGVTVPLPERDFGKNEDGSQKQVTLIRPDGTSVYITQDLGTAALKTKKHKLNRLIYIVGDEQNYHFKTLFALFEMLRFPWAKNAFHLSYGMVELPEGKMKSREGTVVDADDIAAEMTELAEEEITKREREGGSRGNPEDKRKRAQKIGLGAIKFFLLANDPKHRIRFNPKETLSFEGKTGPYCQYAYARCQSILQKIEGEQKAKVDLSELGNPEELSLVRNILKFVQSIQQAERTLNPSTVCEAIHGTAQAFNQFYHAHQVLKAETEAERSARLQLVRATSIVLKTGLALLGIEVVEKM